MSVSDCNVWQFIKCRWQTVKFLLYSILHSLTSQTLLFKYYKSIYKYTHFINCLTLHSDTDTHIHYLQKINFLKLQ